MHKIGGVLRPGFAMPKKSPCNVMKLCGYGSSKGGCSFGFPSTPLQKGAPPKKQPQGQQPLAIFHHSVDVNPWAPRPYSLKSLGCSRPSYFGSWGACGSHVAGLSSSAGDGGEGPNVCRPETLRSSNVVPQFPFSGPKVENSPEPTRKLQASEGETRTLSSLMGCSLRS